MTLYCKTSPFAAEDSTICPDHVYSCILFLLSPRCLSLPNNPTLPTTAVTWHGKMMSRLQVRALLKTFHACMHAYGYFK